MVDQGIKTQPTHRPSEEVLAFLVEKFGEELRELGRQVDDSYVKVKYKGERDGLANLVEGIHYNPIKTTVLGIESGLNYLSILVHNKLMTEVFGKNKERIKYIYGSKEDHTYIISLKNNTFDERDHFRKLLDDLIDTEISSRYVDVAFDFLPEDIDEEEIIKESAVKIDLESK